MKTILLALIILVEIFTIKSWFVCNKFADFFHFSLLDLSLRVDEAVHTDGGVTVAGVRLFHNKAIGTMIDVFRDFLHYWDIVFLENFLSLVGVVGILFAFWYLFQKSKKKPYIIAIFLFVVVIQFVEIFLMPNVNFSIKAVLLFVPLAIITLVGWNEYIEKNKKIGMWVTLIICFISIWWLLVFQDNIFSYCVV